MAMENDDLGFDTLRIVQRLTADQRQRVLAHRWRLGMVPDEGEPVLINDAGDCPLAVALGRSGALPASAIATALLGREPRSFIDDEWDNLHYEAADFIAIADAGGEGEDYTDWTHEVFALPAAV